MPLLDLRTDLKSLKYGSDRLGGGDSGLPYIKTDINTVDRPFNRLRLTKFDDGLIRGGFIGALNSSVVDTLRIGKFLTDFPKGPLFIVKQVGLQLSNPKLETKDLRTDRTGVFGAIANLANRINNTVGPTRIYNLGINTIAQIPVNAFGGHFNRHGILPVQTEDTKYLSVVQSNNQNGSNRLLGLATKFKLGSQEGVEVNSGINRARNFLGRLATTFGINIRGLKPEQLVISEYKGGPESVYGIIGSTTIDRTLEVTNDFKRIGDAAKWSIDYAGKTRDDNGAATEIKIINTQDWGISTRSQSILSKRKFPELPKQISNVNSSFILPIASDKDTTDRDQPVGYTITPNYNNALKVSTQTSSSLSSKGFPELPGKIDNPSGSFPTYIAKNFDTGSDNKVRLKAEQNIFYYGALGVSKQYFTKEESSEIGVTPNTKNITTPNGFDLTRDALIGGEVETNVPSTTEIKLGNISKNYQAYKKIIDSRQLRGAGDIDKVEGQIANEFGLYDQKSGEKYVGDANPINGVLPSATSYPVYQNGYGEVVRINIPWNKVARELRVGSGRQDLINLTPMFDEGNYFGADISPLGGRIRDLVRFRIQAVNTDSPDNGTWMVFRAYLTDLSDSTNPAWGEVSYAGRGDKFYIYNGFDRKISISFKIAALSEEEMKYIYQKLNFLMGQAMPDYSGALMRGPLVRMSIGSWIDSQLGIITSVSFKVPQDSPWEIAVDETEGGVGRLILPHIVEVTLGFTPIGSETRGENLITKKSTTTSHIAQNNTGADVATLQYIGDDNGEERITGEGGTLTGDDLSNWLIARRKRAENLRNANNKK